MTDEDGLFMQVRWFGESWHAPVCEEGFQVDTPAGKRCIECQQVIGERDRGIVTGCSPSFFCSWDLPVDEFVYRVCAYHLRCWMRVVVGDEITGEVLARMRGTTVRKWTGDEVEVTPTISDEEWDASEVVPGRGWGKT